MGLDHELRLFRINANSKEEEGLLEMLGKEQVELVKSIVWRKNHSLDSWFCNNLEEPVENCEMTSVSINELKEFVFWYINEYGLNTRINEIKEILSLLEKNDNMYAKYWQWF